MSGVRTAVAASASPGATPAGDRAARRPGLVGDSAYFLTYPEDRPDDLPPIALFSDLNHPPRRDFVKHLPFSRDDGDRLGGRAQCYSFWAGRDGNPPVQTGASPDRTSDDAILFGYAFHSSWEPDAVDRTAAPYRHPHSFYFSGHAGDPPRALIVSQYFTEFAMTRPDPRETWDMVERFAAGKPIPVARLFGS